LTTPLPTPYRRVPILAACSPHGKFHVVDIDEHGGLPVLMKELLVVGLLHGDCMTCTGKTIAQNLAAVPTVDEINLNLATPQQALSSVASTTHRRLTGLTF
jgi:dihydroxy-acid dehydratase